MNKFIYKVIKWLEDPESVSQEERDKNKKEAYDAAYAAYAADACDAAAAYHAAAYAAENDQEHVSFWVNEYLQETGENKQDYLDAIDADK